MTNQIKSYLTEQTRECKFETPVEIYYSQSCQDLFVLGVLNNKENGSYLELGCSDPVESNNTYLLESKFNWTGISIDIDTTKIDIFNKERSNAGVAQDASTVDFDDLLSQYDDNHVDYLQIDIDNLQATHSVLDGIDFDKFDFSVITFEHDLYRNGIALKMRMKTLMNEKGYVLVSEDVCNTSLEYPYEDWYENPKYVKEEDWKKYECKTKLDTNIFFG